MRKFCQECGNEIKINETFCSECGKPIVKTQGQKPFPQPTIEKTFPNKEPKIPMSIKSKISFIILGILAVSLIAGHLTIKEFTSPEKKVKTFMNAMLDGNKDLIVEQITFPANVVKDNNVFTTYLLSQNIDLFNSRILVAAQELSKDGITRIVSHDNGDEVFRIKQKKFLNLYPVIEIEAIPVNVKLTSDLPNGKYQIADKTFELNKNYQELGAFLPGIYKTTISSDSFGYITSMNDNQQIFGAEDVEIEFNSDQFMVSISSDEPTAIVFIDGKSTNKTVEEIAQIGPIFDDTSLNLYAETKDEEGKIVKSYEKTAFAGEDVALAFNLSVTSEVEEPEVAEVTEVAEETDKEQVYFTNDLLEEFFWNFRGAYQEALNNKDFDRVEYYLKPDTIARQEIKDFIGDIGNEYYLYEFLTDNIIEFDIQGDKAFITTFEEFNFTNHLDVVTNYKRNKKYEIVKPIEGMYQIISIEILDTQREN